MLYITCEKCGNCEGLQNDQPRHHANCFTFDFNALNDPVFTCVDCKKTAKFEYEEDSATENFVNGRGYELPTDNMGWVLEKYICAKGSDIYKENKL